MGFKFNTRHSDEFDIAVRTNQIPYIPEKRQKMVEVLGKDGGYTFEDSYKNIEINLSCSITANTLIERRKTAREITEWLSSAAPSSLIFDYEPDVVYEVVKVTNNVNGVFRGAQVPIDDFDIIFECVPYQKQTFYNNDLIWNDATSAWQYADFPWNGYERVFEATNNASVEITVQNIGTYKALPIIKITVTGEDAYFAIANSNDINDAFAVINLTQPVYVDCSSQVVYTLSGGVKTNKMLDFVGVFIAIQPGTNTYTIGGQYDTLEVEFDYKNTYL